MSLNDAFGGAFEDALAAILVSDFGGVFGTCLAGECLWGRCLVEVSSWGCLWGMSLDGFGVIRAVLG